MKIYEVYKGARGEERKVTESQQRAHPLVQESCGMEVPLGSLPNLHVAPVSNTCHINSVASGGK